MAECVEIVRIKPKSGSEQKLQEIRPRFIADTTKMHPGVLATILVDSGDGTLVDIWLWESREQAQGALDDGANIPGFAEWSEQVDVVSFEMSEVVDRT